MASRLPPTDASATEPLHPADSAAPFSEARLLGIHAAFARQLGLRDLTAAAARDQLGLGLRVMDAPAIPLVPDDQPSRKPFDTL